MPIHIQWPMDALQPIGDIEHQPDEPTTPVLLRRALNNIWEMCRCCRTDGNPEMKDAYRAHRLHFNVHLSTMWTVLMLIYFTVSLIQRALRFPLIYDNAVNYLPEVFPFGVLLFTWLMIRFCGLLRKHTERLLTLSFMLLLGWVVVDGSKLVGAEVTRTHTVSLTLVWPIIEDNPEASTQLNQFILQEETRKYAGRMAAEMLILHCVLQFIGISALDLLMYVAIPVGMWAADQLSPGVAHDTDDLLLFAIPIVACFLACRAYITRLNWRQFKLDWHLRCSLANEAAAMQQVAQQEKQTKEAAIEADTILNHILKNMMADAAGCIHIFVEGLSQPVPKDLDQAMTCLYRGMQWCRRRQALLRITSDQYIPAFKRVNLKELGDKVVCGRPVLCRFPDKCALLDPILCEIVLDNVISNAFRHGHETDPQVTFCINIEPLNESAGSSPRSLSPSHLHCIEGPWFSGRKSRLVFRVTNRANPLQPKVTREFLSEVVSGSHADGRMGTSQHLGLQHSFMAASIHGMELGMFQEDDRVILQACVEVDMDVAREHSTCVLVDNDAPPLPPGLRILCLDDSDVARRLLEHTLARNLKDAHVRALGCSLREVDDFMRGALTDADVLILDQNLAFPNLTLYGNELAKELLEKGFQGLVCIRSANCSPEDVALYEASGAHCVLGKDLRPDELIGRLETVYAEFLHQRQLHVAESLPSHCPSISSPSEASVPAALSSSLSRKPAFGSFFKCPRS